MQNAFWLAYSRIDLFTHQSKFSTWLARIVINRCFLRLRTAQRRPVIASQVATDDGGWYSYEAVTMRPLRAKRRKAIWAGGK